MLYFSVSEEKAFVFFESIDFQVVFECRIQIKYLMRKQFSRIESCSAPVLNQDMHDI